MRWARRQRLERLEDALLGPEAVRGINLSPISAEDMQPALSVPVGRKRGSYDGSLIRAFLPKSPRTAEAVEQVAKLKQHALNVGLAKLGQDADRDAYFDVALPLMFPEPRQPDIKAMAAAVRDYGLGMIIVKKIIVSSPSAQA